MPKKIIIWLSYLDPGLPRRLGRRVARNQLPPRITLNDLLRACETLKLRCEALEDKRYPRTWYMGHKAVVVEYEGKKSQLLKEIARVISSRAS